MEVSDGKGKNFPEEKAEERVETSRNVELFYYERRGRQMSKLLKRWIAVLMCFAMLLAVMPVTALAAESKGGTPVETISTTYINPLYADVMDEADLVKPTADTQADEVDYCSTIEEAGAVVREQLKDRQETVTVGLQAEEMNQQQMHDVFSAALVHTGVPTEGDYLAWQYGGWSCSRSSSTQGGIYYMTLTYTVTYYTTAEQEAQVDAAVESLLSGLALDGKSDYEAVKGIYDWICDNVTYDYDNLEDNSYKLKYTAYGALIDGTSVCQGYAVLLYRLALEQGVDCRFISGTGNGGAHGWNIIRLGGRYYNADSTWDAGRSSYSYFLVCDGNFSDHTRDEEYSTDAFYAAYPMGETDYDPNAVVENPSGTCGEGVTWTLDDAGCLTISGTGDMENYSSSEPAPWKDYRDRIESVVIEEGVTRLGAYSFQDCTALTSAVVPNSLVRNGYGEGAFQGCSSLTSVNIPDGIVVIYDYTFDGCSSLTTIDIPDSVSNVCMDAFTDCAARRTDEQGIVTVDTWAVAFTGSASEITIPAGITGIGLDAFCGCAGLTGVVFPDSLRYINEEAFLRCTGLTEVDIPGQVTAIERFVFEGCSNLVSVHLPDGITIIDEDAFHNCESLTTINIPDSVTGIYRAFSNCTSLAAIDLPEGLKTIGENAFYGCISLTGVDVPGSVTEIGWGAFGDCSRLEEICFYGDAPIIREEAFSGVTATAYYPAGNETWTGDVMQDYGGTLTWVAKEQAVDNPFTDVQETDYYYDAVLWAYSNGITSGTSETMFSPDNPCTRGQVVTFIWRAMGEPEPTITENPFTDVKASEYYYKAVLWAYEQGIVAGKTETSFAPEDTVTRAQVVTFLWRMEGSPEPESTNNPFTDVKETNYYYQAVLWAYENGITAGVTETLFKPEATCTRAQVVCFLYRDMGETSKTAVPDEKSLL